MLLSDLLQVVPEANVTGRRDHEVSSIAYHTDAVGPGAMFVALPGAKVDGRTWVPQAVARGATVVVCEGAVSLPVEVTGVQVANARVALGQLAARWFGEPTMAVRLVGVTGTNGKTTLTYLLEAIWRAAHRSPGVVGTINYRYGTTQLAAPTTTPESWEIQRLCRTMVDHGVTDVAMEVSSHALVQHRVDACQFDGAIFTNLSQDHLDYHGTMAAYAAAKRRFFAELLPTSRKSTRFAVVNGEDPATARLCEGVPVPIWRYGRTSDCEIRATEVRTGIQGIAMRVQTPHGAWSVESPLLGDFNVMNLLAAIGAATAMQIDPREIQAGIAAMAQVPGRLERVPGTGGVTVVVDYAHTPDALINVGRTLRQLAPARLLTVFGCGGDRDPSKRPLMGEAAAGCSDLVIVTSDNPRTEDPQAIIDQIRPGLGGAAHEVMVDRAVAIRRALQMARPGDIVLIAGKGHEDYQIIGTQKRHFDDREVVREFFAGAACS